MPTRAGSRQKVMNTPLPGGGSMQTPVLPGWQKAQFGGAFATVVKKAGRGAKTQAGNAIVVTCAGGLSGLRLRCCTAAQSAATSLCTHKRFDLKLHSICEHTHAWLSICKTLCGSVKHPQTCEGPGSCCQHAMPVWRCCSAAPVKHEHLHGRFEADN